MGAVQQLPDCVYIVFVAFCDIGRYQAWHKNQSDIRHIVRDKTVVRRSLY